MKGLALATLATLVMATGALASSRVSVNDSVSLHPVSAGPGRATEKGSASGSIPASVSVNFRRSGNNVSGSLGASARNGWFGGTLSGTLTRTSSTHASFSGTLHLSRGTGRYRNSSGSLHLSGTLNTTNLAASLRITGSFSD